MNKPKLLDLFCCAGGAGMGYHRAGFDVTGVDIAPQPHYPFVFIQADALEYVAAHGNEYDVIHASPPCQEYSSLHNLRDANAPRQGAIIHHRPAVIGELRALLNSFNALWIIENVVGSPLMSGITLCGSMFDLPIRRHRWFESRVMLLAPGGCRHTKAFYNLTGGCVRGLGSLSSTTTYYAPSKNEIRRREGHAPKSVGVKAMGIDWMTLPEMCESIPPAYTEYIGRQLIAAFN